MTKEELKQEAEEWLCNNLHSASEEDFIKAMVDIAEPREKRIAELEQKLEQIEKDLADYQFNYPTIKELEAEVKEWKDKADLWCKTANLKDHNIMINKELEKENAELKEKYNELSKAVFELKGEFMACPLDDTDRLSELIDRLNNL